jgi:hypothetical protein
LRQEILDRSQARASVTAWLFFCPKRAYWWVCAGIHGFAVHDPLRGCCPQAASLLIDRQTQLAHRLD